MRKSKILTFILMIILVFSTIIQDASHTDASSMPPKYENGGAENYYENQTIYENIKSQLPDVAPGQKAPATLTLSNGTKVPLNYRLWTQKGIVVYGNYKSIPGNRFKCGFQDGINPATGFPNEYKGGYYLVNLNTYICSVHGKNCPDKDANSYVRGEWQYYGYDVTGNRFSNIAFINDANVTKFNQRDWIKEPWRDELRPSTKLYEGISTYNQYAYRLDGTDVRNWIGDTLEEMGGVPTLSGVDPEVYKYLYIQSAPTIMYSGSGRMWHQRPTAVWYQSLSVPVLTEKQQPQVTAEITYVTGTYNTTEKKTVILMPENESFDDEIIYIDVTIKGTLKDEEYYNDEVLRTTFYTRQDIKSWNFTVSIFGKTYTEDNVPINSKSDNTKTYEFVKRIPVTYGQLRSATKNGALGTVTAQPTYENGVRGVIGTDYFGIGPAVIPEKPLPLLRDISSTVPEFNIGNSISETAFDGVPFKGAVENTDMSKVTSVSVYVNGQPVNHSEFFSGDYIFPPTTDRNGYLAQVEVVYRINKATILPDWLSPDARQQYMDDIQDEYKSVDVVYVYPTTPNAHFTISSSSWKENRLINVTNTSVDANIKLVMDHYPITEYRWFFGGDTSKLQFGTNTDLEKQLQYSEPGTYSITLQAKNTLNKWSEPYTVNFTVLQDYKPNVEVTLTDSVITRNDEITAWHYDVNSTDGDKITTVKIELWYDADNNGSVDTKIQEWNGSGDNGIVEKEDFPSYKPDKLGYYVYKVFADEEYVGVPGQDTLSTSSNAKRKSAQYDIEFWVDNYQPLADLYLNAPIERPNVDLLIMLDKDLEETKKEALTLSRLDMENWLLGKNIIPNVSIWNLKTYTYSQDASTTYNSGSLRPPATIPYESSGYSGTLTKTSEWDNGSYYDYGYYTTTTESRSFSASWANSCYTTFDKNGKQISNSDNPAPSSYYINQDGYSGYLPKTNVTQDGPYRTDHADGSYTIHNVWTAHYSGTLTKTVTVWVPDVRWRANWYGSYSGKIYKDIKQPYTDPYNGGNTYKYILYISDNVISDTQDYSYAKSKADAKIILAGKPGIKDGNTYHHFIDATGKTIDEITDEALNYIAQASPAVEEVIILQNENFELHTGNFDLEDDQIIQEQLQYVHEANYYDNPTGQEPGTLKEPDLENGWTTTILSKFANVGRYRIMRRIKDMPAGNLGSQYSYYSGVSEVNVLVHRRPIADAVLDWTYNPSTGLCDTIWVDRSYDLDHSISMENKGIVDRKIKFRKNGGEWLYYIPASLDYGTYDVEYYVQDIEGAWSEPWKYSFTLGTNPQFSASARALDSAFTLDSIPASEYIEAYSLWTRQPGNVALDFTLTPTVSNLPAKKTVAFQQGVTATQNGQDITWYNQVYQIPSVMPDGPRTFTVTARDTATGVTTAKTFTVNIITPIDLVPGIDGQTLTANQATTITATTSKYPVTTTVQMQYGTAYQSGTLNMTGAVSGNAKEWAVSYTIPNSVPDGTYTARFVSTLPCNPAKTEVKLVTYTVTHNRPPTVTITGTTPTVVYEGDDVAINFNVSDPDKDPITCDVRLKRGPATIWTQSIVVSPVGSNYAPVSLPSIQDIPLGSYTIEITARDPYDASDFKTYNFNARSMTISGDIQPNPAMAGEMVTITANTEGYTERVIVTMWNGDTVELIPEQSTANLNNRWTSTYTVPLHTPDSTYPVNFTAIRGSIERQYYSNLTILGNLLNLVRPRIRDSN